VQYSQLFWGVLSTFAAFLVGLAWRHLSRVLIHLRARHFWRPLVSHDSVVVVGSFRDLPGFEASGVIGMGDNIALNELEHYFASIGFKRFTVHYSHHIRWADTDGRSPLQGNLILLGGPDANLVTRLVLERVALGIEFLEIRRDQLTKSADGERVSRFHALAQRRRSRAAALWRIPVILDKESGHLHAPVLDQDELRGDCGVLVRCRNPFNERREVIIFCGSYGYGTWAAVRYAQSREFFRHVPKDSKSLECVLAVQVVAETPQGIRMELLRSVSDSAPPNPAGVVVPRIVT
jgi:hypothetical protein